jgi:hypothetical protein
MLLYSHTAVLPAKINVVRLPAVIREYPANWYNRLGHELDTNIPPPSFTASAPDPVSMVIFESPLSLLTYEVSAKAFQTHPL